MLQPKVTVAVVVNFFLYLITGANANGGGLGAPSGTPNKDCGLPEWVELSKNSVITRMGIWLQ